MFFHTIQGTGAVNMTRLTCCTNSGDTVIESMRATPARISFANFIGNPVTSGYAVLYADSAGMFLTSCIFAGNRINSAASDIYLANTQDAGRFTLADCVFDAGLPGANHFDAVGPVYTSTTTATHTLWGIDTFVCPAVIVRPSATFTASALFSEYGRPPRRTFRLFFGFAIFVS
jgi:hypothetical protein